MYLFIWEELFTEKYLMESMLICSDPKIFEANKILVQTLIKHHSISEY